MRNTDADALRQAQSIIYQAKLQILTERALKAQARRPGLGYVRLYPPSRATYLVTYFGRLLGRVRWDPGAPPETWCLAMAHGAAHPLGGFPTVRGAAAALAEAAGFDLPETPSWTHHATITP